MRSVDEVMRHDPIPPNEAGVGRSASSAEAGEATLIQVEPSAGMEDFFDRFAQLSPEQLQDVGYLAGLFSQYVMQVVGPPLPPAMTRVQREPHSQKAPKQP